MYIYLYVICGDWAVYVFGLVGFSKSRQTKDLGNELVWLDLPFN